MTGQRSLPTVKGGHQSHSKPTNTEINAPDLIPLEEGRTGASCPGRLRVFMALENCFHLTRSA